ncbi:MAG: hypothetical protein HYY17_04250 [Planctomycetes bacterium]|nr:hypothetical protein [Planctomycetota bacterium]
MGGPTPDFRLVFALIASLLSRFRETYHASIVNPKPAFAPVFVFIFRLLSRPYHMVEGG